ncbi:MAG TPA: ABC transporter permease [Candidatus Dormibacteraeota bacterium]|jgi:ABC-type antimicrobial peptide transport system permease subunit
MKNPLSLWRFFLRNKRKVLPVVGILALAILGVVVTDSLLASARQTAYATYGSYQKLILVAPRATRDQDLSNPLQDALTRLNDVQAKANQLNTPAEVASLKAALNGLAVSLGSISQPQSGLESLLATAQKMPGTTLVQRDAYSNLDINLFAGDAQFDLYGLDRPGMTSLLNLYGDRLLAGRLPSANANEVVISEEIARSRKVWIGGKVGNSIDELDRLPDAFTVVGIIRGPTRLGLIPLEYMTQHYLFERRYQGLVVVPQTGHETQVHDLLLKAIGKQPFRIFDYPYIKAKIDSLIENLDTINRFLIVLVTVVLSLVVGLLNNLFFRQRMNEFGLLAGIGYNRWRLILRVATESLAVTVISWVIGVGLGVAVLSWFNQVFMVPHGLLMNVFDWNVLLVHTLPIPVMVFLFGMGTVAWQLLRLDPISIIERRD